MVAIAAIGATFVILTGGIDLSTGSVIGASGVAGAWIITSSGNLAAGIAAGLFTGTAIGLVVGIVVARLNVVPFAGSGARGTSRALGSGPLALAGLL